MSSVGMLTRLATELAEDQWGLLTRAQALAMGVPRATFARLVAAGALVRVAHGVYRVAGGPDAGHLDLRAAWLQFDPLTPAWQRVQSDRVAVVSHRSAAELYGLGDLIADIHEFAVPVRTQTRRQDVRLYVRQVPPEDRDLTGGLPVTRAHRIVADLLDVHEDGSAVATIAVEAVRRGLTTVNKIAESVAPFARRYQADDGTALANQLLSNAA
ncbi:type IV toxin-antitoxin system AbiEi family antitoxin domain-containing protein [Dactylosporangium sp. NPDC050588]|uniref:type IV toxin-antitoxin system AbiEi family antitoxin domain-containing protein n=1 Tax=Dactylosporangium sp. NPDC050588 TaxID=3157211 RepID=UPI0033D4D675